MARAAKLDLRAFQQELAARLAAKTTQQVEQSRLGLACAGKQCQRKEPQRDHGCALRSSTR